MKLFGTDGIRGKAGEAPLGLAQVEVTAAQLVEHPGAELERRHGFAGIFRRDGRIFGKARETEQPEAQPLIVEAIHDDLLADSAGEGWRDHACDKRLDGRTTITCVVRDGVGTGNALDNAIPAAAGFIRPLARASLDHGVPVIFGVLTTETLEQAINRAGAKAGNHGFGAAVTAVEMVNLLRKLPG